MKTSEMNSRQLKAFKNIYHAANWHIGGLENGLLDYPAESDEYKRYDAELKDHAGLVETIYQIATTEVYEDGGVFFGRGAESFIKDVRFCGKPWLMERVEKRVSKMGY